MMEHILSVATLSSGVRSLRCRHPVNVGNNGTNLRVEYVITAGGIIPSLRRVPAQTLAILQALENDENTVRVLQHEQKKAVHWEPWQSPVKVAQPSLKPAKPIHPGAMGSLQAIKERATKSTEKSEAPNPAQRTSKGTKRKWESESESEAEESEEPEADADKDEGEEDNSDESGTQTVPAKALKWSYVPYQHETTDEWKVAPGIAPRS